MKFKNWLKNVFERGTIKRSLAWLIISVVVVMVFSLFGSMAQSAGFKTEVVDLYGDIQGLGDNMSIKMFKPKTATAERPAPLVVATHGYLNNKEMVDMTAVELSRRGYVVVTVDAQVLGGYHGESGYFTDAVNAGLYQVVEYFSKFDWIDAARIGVTGHSMGGTATSGVVQTYGKAELAALTNAATKWGIAEPPKTSAAVKASLEGLTKAAAEAGIQDADFKAEVAAMTDADFKAAVKADIDKAMAENKIAAALVMANSPPTGNIGLKTSVGLLYGSYDEFFFKTTGAKAVLNTLTSKKNAAKGGGQTPADPTHNNQTQYEFLPRNYRTSAAAANFIKTIYPGLETYQRATLPAEGEEGYDAKVHGPIWKELDKWNEKNPDDQVTAPATKLTLPKEEIENWGIYTASGAHGSDYFSFKNPATEPFRAMYQQNEIHPWNHFSVKSSKASSTFFMAAFGAPYEGARYISAGNQMWWVKEMFNFFALIGFFMAIVPIAQLLLRIPVFAKGKKDTPEPLPALKKPVHWIVYLVPALLLSLICGFAIRFFVQDQGMTFAGMLSSTQWFPSVTTGYVANWAFWTGLIALLFFVVLHFAWNRPHGRRLANMGVKLELTNVLRMLGVAVVTVVSAFSLLGIVDYFFHTDFRLWTFAVKTFSAVKIPTAINYMLIFGIYYFINALVVNAGTRFKNVPDWLSTIFACFFNVFGILVMFAVQYFTFFNTGALYYWDLNLKIIVLFPIVPILIVATILARKLYNASGSVWLPAFVNTILFTLITVTGTIVSSTLGWYQFFGL